MRYWIPLFLTAMVLAQTSDYDTLAARLENRDPLIRREAAKKLGELGDRRAIPALGKMVKDLDEETRFRAVEAIARLLDRESILYLAEALRDPSRRVKEAAIDGMVTLYITTRGPGGLVGIFNRAVEVFHRSSEDLVVAPGTQVDARVVKALGDAVGDPDNEVARDAARAVGILHGNDAVKPMADLLFHAPTTVKMEILRAFQKIRDPLASKDTARLLTNSDKVVRAQAAYTLGLLGAQDQSPALRKLFEDDGEREVRRRAFEALSLMPSAGEAAWFAGFLEDKDDRMREFAADALGRLPQPGIDDTLRARREAEKNGRVRLSLAFALAAHGHGEFLGELMDSLNSTFNRQYGQTYLVELGRDASHLASFYPYLESGRAGVRRYLCDVFGSLGNPAALEHVRPLIKDSNNNVVTAAIRAVQILERVPR